jgi:hypothetical protein
MVTKSLATALAKAQGEMKNAVLNKTNPHFKSKFADLAAVRDATIPALTSNGLSIVQFTKIQDGALTLITRLMHDSGELIDGEYPLPPINTAPQQMGSALTYAKRYCWSAMCGIAADEDDDAEAAQNGSAAPANDKKNFPGISKYREEQRAFRADMFACTDYDQYVAFANTKEAKAFVEKARTQFPNDWNGDGGDIKGLRQEMVEFCDRLKETPPQIAAE